MIPSKTATARPGTRLGARLRNAVFTLVFVAALNACTTNPYAGEREVSSKAQGAGIGVAVGTASHLTITPMSPARASIGALAGTAVGVYMDTQEIELREQLVGTGVSVVRLGDDIVLYLPADVTFAGDQGDVQLSFYAVLNSVALVLDEYTKTLIDVNGHSDDTGTLEYNLDLSNRRAKSVATYLTSRGIERGRIYTQGYGPHSPMAENSTAEGRRTNRRVELVLKPLITG